ncbi:hypothetical protein LCGC14_1950940 [marine sediment metagenome]|uniref:Uncharacterized protein n=1 Tax=marine sediment metagenome TaxID=412755 RepID=A0A0F9G5W0_9ZZZZ
MPTEEGLSQAIGCLSTVFPQFLAIEIARLTDEVVSATQAITDPLAAIANKDVQGMVDDVATLAEGNIVESMGAVAVGLAGSYAKREIQDRLEEMALANPGAVKKIQQSRNVGEQVLAGSMIMFALFNEAPYVVAQKMCEKIIKLCDMKLAQLQCMKKHVVQMNNSIAALAKAKNEIVNFTAELQRLSIELGNARTDLRTAVGHDPDGTIFFNESAIARAVTNLKDADSILDPQSSGLNLLDVTKILTSGTTSSSHITTSNIKLASMALPHLNFMLEAQAAAVGTVTDAINFNLVGIVNVLGNFRSSATSGRAAEIRERAIKGLISKIENVKNSVDAAIASGSTRSKTAKSLLWSSQIKSITTTADKVQSATYTEGSSEGPTKAAQLQSAYDQLITTINQIDSANVENGIDDVFDLKILINALRKSGNKLLATLDDRPATSQSMLNFTVLVCNRYPGRLVIDLCIFLC